MLIGGDCISNDVITLDVITLGFSMLVYIRSRFRFALIGGNLTAQSTESHRGTGGGIQIPETRSLVKNCELLDVRATGMHSIITGCSCVISMDLTVCHKQWY